MILLFKSAKKLNKIENCFLESKLKQCFYVPSRFKILRKSSLGLLSHHLSLLSRVNSIKKTCPACKLAAKRFLFVLSGSPSLKRFILQQRHYNDNKESKPQVEKYKSKISLLLFIRFYLPGRNCFEKIYAQKSTKKTPD